MKNIIVAGFVFLGLTINTTLVQAHHSFAATYTDSTTTVEGYVEQLKFNNPHVAVVFNVTDGNGEVTQWVTEGLAATSLRRLGWDRNTLKKGDYIRVSGNTTRNGSPMVSMGTLQVVDPVTGAIIREPGSGESTEYETADTNNTSIPMKLDSGLPNLTGSWTMGVRGGGGPSGAGAGERPTNAAPPQGGSGRSADGGRGPDPSDGPAPFNEAGTALQATYDPADDPQVQCEPPGLVRQAGFTPHPVRIEQYDDHVLISYEEYGGERKIYFDDRDLVGGEKTHLGQSKARYEGDTLIIESNNLLSNLSSPGGQRLSDQASTVETYSRKPDQDGRSVLAMNMVISDPVYLTDTWSMTQDKYYSHAYEFIDVVCEKPL